MKSMNAWKSTILSIGLGGAVGLHIGKIEWNLEIIISIVVGLIAGFCIGAYAMLRKILK